MVDVPYNGDPELVEPAPGIAPRLARLRQLGVKMAVVSNQSGIARGLIAAADVEAVNRRVDELLGRFDDWRYCPHGPAGACDCRKPRPKLLLDAAAAMGVAPCETVMLGDKPSDAEAAANAGMRSVLVSAQSAADALDRIVSEIESGS